MHREVAWLPWVKGDICISPAYSVTIFARISAQSLLTAPPPPLCLFFSQDGSKQCVFLDVCSS